MVPKTLDRGIDDPVSNFSRSSHHLLKPCIAGFNESRRCFFEVRERSLDVDFDRSKVGQSFRGERLSGRPSLTLHGVQGCGNRLRESHADTILETGRIAKASRETAHLAAASYDSSFGLITQSPLPVSTWMAVRPSPRLAPTTLRPERRRTASP